MQPVRILRSEDELRAMALNSIVCPAYAPASIYQVGSDGLWSEPGVEEDIPTNALWEVLTGAYETIVLDEDREVWVMYDAAAPQLGRPPRGADSPDFLTRAKLGDRNTEWVTHATLADARAEIESLVAGRPSADNLLIYAREDKDRIDFYTIEFLPAGTTLAGLPWRK